MLQRSINLDKITPMTHKWVRNPLKEFYMNQMFDFKEAEKKFQDLTKQMQQLNEFWINAVISSLKNFQK